MAALEAAMMVKSLPVIPSRTSLKTPSATSKHYRPRETYMIAGYVRSCGGCELRV